MSHISSLTAVMFSDLSVSNYSIAEKDWISLQDPDAATAAASLGKLFDNKSAASATSPYSLTELSGTTDALAGEYIRITHLKEFPALGTPPNITKVPEYGSKTSKQVQGQADLPNMEITLNYLPSLWENNAVHDEESGSAKDPKVGDGKTYVFRFTLLGTEPSGYDSTSLKDTEHSCFYFLGKLEALEVTSSLTEAMTAKLTISVQSEIKGAYTNA